MGLETLRPARESETVTVLDLDKIVVQNLEFRFRGQTHILKPISNKAYFVRALAAVKIANLSYNDPEAVKKAHDTYFDLISSVCDTITREDIDQMAPVQSGALVDLICEKIAGKTAISEEEKKKTLVN